MSYDLDFVRAPSDGAGFADVVRAAAAQPLIKRVEETALVYDNPDTGVHFNIEASAYTEGAPPQYPDRFEYAGASFNLNLVRPSFFAQEAMPVVADVARNAGLKLYDLQLAAIVDDSQHLVDGWLRSNRQAIAAASDLTSRFVMPQEKAMAYWRYQKDRARLTDELAAEEIFVPTLFLFRPAGANEVQTAMTWTSDVYMVVPPSDWAIVVRRKKRWVLRDKQEIGYLSSAELMSKIAPLLKPFRNTGWQMLPRENAKAVGDVLNSIALKMGLSRFQRVTADEFTDIGEL